MLDLDLHPSGRHFLQNPGPSPVPDRILRAMSLPTIDHHETRGRRSNVACRNPGRAKTIRT